MYPHEVSPHIESTIFFIPEYYQSRRSRSSYDYSALMDRFKRAMGGSKEAQAFNELIALNA